MIFLRRSTGSSNPTRLGVSGMIMETDFDEFTAQVRARKIELGITDADFQGFDNAGLQRTESKRRNLAVLRLRALEAGVEPLPANF